MCGHYGGNHAKAHDSLIAAGQGRQGQDRAGANQTPNSKRQETASLARYSLQCYTTLVPAAAARACGSCATGTRRAKIPAAGTDRRQCSAGIRPALARLQLVPKREGTGGLCDTKTTPKPLTMRRLGVIGNLGGKRERATAHHDEEERGQERINTRRGGNRLIGMVG